MKKILIIALIISLVFIAGCKDRNDPDTYIKKDSDGNIKGCKDPYIMSEGICCLDENEDNICDIKQNPTSPPSPMDRIK